MRVGKVWSSPTGISTAEVAPESGPSGGEYLRFGSPVALDSFQLKYLTSAFLRQRSRIENAFIFSPLYDVLKGFATGK